MVYFCTCLGNNELKKMFKLKKLQILTLVVRTNSISIDRAYQNQFHNQLTFRSLIL